MFFVSQACKIPVDGVLVGALFPHGTKAIKMTNNPAAPDPIINHLLISQGPFSTPEGLIVKLKYKQKYAAAVMIIKIEAKNQIEKNQQHFPKYILT